MRLRLAASVGQKGEGAATSRSACMAADTKADVVGLDISVRIALFVEVLQPSQDLTGHGMGRTSGNLRIPWLGMVWGLVEGAQLTVSDLLPACLMAAAMDKP